MATASAPLVGTVAARLMGDLRGISRTRLPAAFVPRALIRADRSPRELTLPGPTSDLVPRKDSTLPQPEAGGKPRADLAGPRGVLEGSLDDICPVQQLA
jgi:hypothetical protein